MASSQLLSNGAQRAQAQGLQLDESCGVCLVVGAAVILEGRQSLIVQAVRALAADQDHVALPPGAARSAPRDIASLAIVPGSGSHPQVETTKRQTAQT